MSNSIELINSLSKQGIVIRESNSDLGGNSKFYKFIFGGKQLVLKVYLGDEFRIRNSRDREHVAYQFLEQNHFLKLPKLIKEFDLNDGICLEYIEGVRPQNNSSTNRVILNSFSELHNIYHMNQCFDNATDATYSTNEVLNQVEKRMDVFSKTLSEEFSAMISVVRRLRTIKPFDFPDGSVTYSLSDVGPHNMIKSSKGYYFLDLEFFGRDSAVKMFLDYILHPRNNASFRDRIETLDLAAELFEIDRKSVV